MARKIRAQCPGAIRHAVNRGNRRDPPNPISAFYFPNFYFSFFSGSERRTEAAKKRSLSSLNRDLTLSFDFVFKKQ
jgi:hypothetical protein